MLSPTLYGVTTFDAEIDGYTFEYLWSGPAVSMAKLTIKNNDDETVVAEIENDGGLTIVLPPNTITNNQKYNAYVVLYDYDVEQEEYYAVSDQSNVIGFQCFTKPQFYLVDENDNPIGTLIDVGSSQMNFRIKYFQDEGDFLSQVKFTLYNTNNVPVIERNTQYFSTDESSGGLFYASELFTGFIDDTDYKIRVIGRSQSGVNLDTDYVLIRVNYETPSMFLKLDPTNQMNQGTIRLVSNLIAIEGETESGEDPIFINNSEVDVREDKVIFIDGFLIPNDYNMGMTLRGFSVNKELLSWNDEICNASVFYREGSFDINDGIKKGYFELNLYNGYGSAIINSNFINPIVENSDKFTIWISRQNGYYRITCYKDINLPVGIVSDYSGQPIELAVPGVHFNGTYLYKLSTDTEYQSFIPIATNAGEYTVNYKCVSGDVVLEQGDIISVINKVPTPYKIPTAKSIVYNGNSQNLVEAGSADYGVVYYKIGSGDYSTEIPSKTDAGSYSVQFKVLGDQNHLDVEPINISTKINRASINTIPSSSVNKVYTGQSVSNGYTVPSGIIKTGQDSATNIGIYTAVYTPDSNHQWNDGTIGSLSTNMTIWQYGWNRFNCNYTDETSRINQLIYGYENNILNLYKNVTLVEDHFEFANGLEYSFSKYYDDREKMIIFGGTYNGYYLTQSNNRIAYEIYTSTEIELQEFAEFGQQGSYFDFVFSKLIQHTITPHKLAQIDTVFSNSNTYPVDDELNGYWYTKINSN